jgi:hypothetical protein
MCNQNIISNKFDLILTTTLSSYYAECRYAECHYAEFYGALLLSQICRIKSEATLINLDRGILPNNALANTSVVQSVASRD